MAAAGTVSRNVAGAVIAVADPLGVCQWPRYRGTLAPSSTNVSGGQNYCRVLLAVSPTNVWPLSRIRHFWKCYWQGHPSGAKGSTTMRSAILALGVLFLLTGGGVLAAPPRGIKKSPPAIPRKALNELKPILARIKETPPRVESNKPGEFFKTRLVATNVQATPEESDFADKPYKVLVRWKSDTQQTKFYSEENVDEKATEWLPPSRVAGSRNSTRISELYRATLYLIDGKWVLDGIEWSGDYGNIRPPPGYGGVSSTQRGDSTLWTQLLPESN